MTIQESHIDFLLKKDRVQSLTTKHFTSEEIDWLLNDAQINFINTKYNLNQKRYSFESNQSRIDDLSLLHIVYPEQPELTLTNNILYLDALKYKYWHLTSVSVKVKDCAEMLIPRYIEEDDKAEFYKNPFSEKVGYNISMHSSKESIQFFTKKEIEYVKVSYIKYPDRVNLGTYEYIDGITYPPKTFELSSNTHTFIVDLAVELSTDIAAQNIKQKNLKNE